MNKKDILMTIDWILVVIICVFNYGYQIKVINLTRENARLNELVDELGARLTYSEQALKEQVGEADFYRRLWEENK